MAINVPGISIRAFLRQILNLIAVQAYSRETVSCRITANIFPTLGLIRRECRNRPMTKQRVHFGLTPESCARQQNLHRTI
jgi:hypothetical protein